MNMQKMAAEMTKEDKMTDFEMELWLYKRGIMFSHDEEHDEEVAKTALLYGFHWKQECRIWVK